MTKDLFKDIIRTLSWPFYALVFSFVSYRRTKNGKKRDKLIEGVKPILISMCGRAELYLEISLSQDTIYVNGHAVKHSVGRVQVGGSIPEVSRFKINSKLQHECS